jgi:drug/metabolite transporter (DMT)-like permease
MDYLLVMAAVFCVASSFVFARVYQKRYIKGVSSLLFYPIPVALVSILFFLCLTGFHIGFTTFTFVMALIYALAGTLYSVLGLIIVRLGKLSVYMIFLMLGGMLIPFVYGIVFLNETLTGGRIVGIVFLIISLFMPFIGLKRSKTASSDCAPVHKGNQKLYIILCICVFFLNGCVSTVSKVHQINKSALDTNEFLVWINFFNLVLSALVFGIYKLYILLNAKNKKYRENPNFTKSEREKTAVLSVLLLLSIIALFTCGGGLLLMLGAKSLPASVLFPLTTGGTIILTSLAGWIFFKERIHFSLGIGLVLTFIGTMLFLF